MMSYTRQDGTVLLFPTISDTALVNVTPATFFDKLMESNQNVYRSLTRPVVTCIYILMGVSRRLTDSPQSHVRLQAQDMVKRWETSGEWKTLASIMKKEPHPATTLPYNIDSSISTFQFDDWTFTLPQIHKNFFDQGVLDIVSFSKAFAEGNGHQAVAESIMRTAVAHFAVIHFPNTAAELFIKFSDQVHSLYREIALEERVYLSGLSEKDPLDKVVSAPTMMNSMELRDSKSEDQSEVNGMSKGSGSNAPCKAHVSQQLELLPSAPTRDIASRRCSIFVSLPSSIGPRSTTHAHLIRSKSGNGTMLCQIEIVARNEPSLILSCPSTAHRDSILKFLAERNMSHGWENAATLSVEKAEENDASIGARWILPIKFNNSNSAIFGAVEQSFQTSGMIPVRDITEDTDATGIKRGFLVIHASSETWLKKYAMTPNGHKALVLRVEYTVSRECRICQTLLPEHDSRLPASTSNPAVKVVQDHEATSRISLHPQLHDIQGATRSTELRTNTALEVESIPKKSGVQPTGIAVVHGPWKLPAVQSGTLSGVTISKFVADLVELNGEERSCSATGQEIVTAFNDYIDINYPESSYKEKVKALRRKCHEVVATSFHPNLPALQKYRHMMRGEMPCAELPSAITVPLELKDTGEGSQHMDPLAGHSIRRRIKYRTIKNGDGLDPATPGILMSSGDMTPGVESRGCRAANEASQQPESHPRTHGRQEAKGREPSNERGAKVTSRRRRRPRAKSEITCFSENSVTPGGDAHDNAMRKSQKTTHSQNPSILVARNGVDMTSKGIRAGDLEEADKFLSEVGKELEAKAARKIRFSSHSE